MQEASTEPGHLEALRDSVRAFVARGDEVRRARSQRGKALYWVERDASGMALSFQPLADGTFDATLTPRDVRISADQAVVSPGMAPDVLTRALRDATLISSAELAAMARRLLDITLDQLRTRSQFGKPIGSFQALQHRATDCFVQIGLFCSKVCKATWVIGRFRPAVGGLWYPLGSGSFCRLQGRSGHGAGLRGAHGPPEGSPRSPMECSGEPVSIPPAEIGLKSQAQIGGQKPS